TRVPGRTLFRRQRVTQPQLALFTRRLAILVAAGVPVFDAMTTLWEQELEGELKLVLGRLRERLAEGVDLARAMSQEPAIFSEGYVGMVTAGLSSGALDRVLERLAQFLEDQQALRSRAITAFIYPMLMAVVGSCVLFFLLTVVVPKITIIFQASKATLPLITRLLLLISDGLRLTWWFWLLLLVAGLYYHRRHLADEGYRLRLHRLLMKTPLLGPFAASYAVARFSRILGLLLESGVPMLKGLEITGYAVTNRLYRLELDRVRQEVAEGGILSSALGRSPLFPPLLVQMIAVGEQGGELDQMLNRAGQVYEKEFDAGVTRVMALLEPLLILVMALVVGFIVVAILLPIFELNQLVR
ncbi:MAG TPA: type II secretion system F family protein, partial [Geobacterales bacterium]|nr:type II secretion system F family protein [Geobacterales bacterium]